MEHYQRLATQQLNVNEERDALESCRDETRRAGCIWFLSFDRVGWLHARDMVMALQDILRLLTLWFNYGHLPEVEAALVEGFGHVSINTWLSVIPKLSHEFIRIHHLFDD